MKVFVGRVRPVAGLLIDGVAWGLVPGAAVLLADVVVGVLSGSLDPVFFGMAFAFVGCLVGPLVGVSIGLVAGLLFEAWARVRAPAPVVALGTVAPVFACLYAVSEGLTGDGLRGWGTPVAIVAAGPLVADVLHRARRLEVERAGQVHPRRDRPMSAGSP